MKGQDVTVTAATLMIIYWVHLLWRKGEEGEREEDRVLPVAPDAILLTKFDNMYFKVKNDLQTQFKYMNYFIYTSHPYIFYHLLETGKGFHIRPPDDNTGFSLNRSHRKDLKQCPSMFKSLELVHMETGYPGEVRYLSYPW